MRLPPRFFIYAVLTSPSGRQTFERVGATDREAQVKELLVKAEDTYANLPHVFKIFEASYQQITL